MRIWTILTLVAAGCGMPPVVAVTPTSARAQRVVVVTLDGVRWQEIFRGVDTKLARRHRLPASEIVGARELLPEIHRRFVDAGTALGGEGPDVSASGPMYVSLPGYREIFSGRGSSACVHNGCPYVSRPTLLDELDGELAVIASWETLERAAAADLSRVSVSAGRRHGATRDRLRVSRAAGALLDAAAAVGPWPGHDDYRPDVWTSSLALAYLETRQPRLLFVGLGDTDEHAHAGDYRRYLGALKDADAFIGRLFAILEASGRLEETVVILTTDHGRAADFSGHGPQPESARVFVLAAGAGVARRGLSATDAPRRLADIAPTLRKLLGRPEIGPGIPELLSSGLSASLSPRAR